MTKEECGQLTVLRVEQRALEKGFIVSRPSTQVRYDLIVDDGKERYRVQVKYANGKSSHSTGVATVDFRRRGKKYLRGQIDSIAVYVAPVGCVCWFGPDLFDQRRGLTIRYAPSKNRQGKKCLLVETFKW